MLETKVQQIEDLSLKLSLLASPNDPSNNAAASNLAATGRLYEAVNKEAHKRIGNAKKVVVFIVPDRLLMPLVQSTILHDCSMTQRPFLCSWFQGKSLQNNCLFHSNFAMY